MGKTKRRHQFPRSREEGSHWLGEGYSGQNSLLFDIDPYFYAADQTVCRTASQISHHYDGLEAKPLAVINSPHDVVPWHVGYLKSRFFDLVVLSAESDPLLDEMSEQFNVSLFSGGAPSSLNAQVDFLLFLESLWPDPLHVQAALKQADLLLATDGRATLLFAGIIEEGEVFVMWSDGTRQGLDQIANEYVLRDFSGYETSIIELRSLQAQHELGVTEFAKRHKEFFGKNTRDFILARLRESDMLHAFSSNHVCIALTVFAGE